MKINYLFMLVVLDFVSDWYSLHKISSRSSNQLNKTFDNINSLRGTLRDSIEGSIRGNKNANQ